MYSIPRYVREDPQDLGNAPSASIIVSSVTKTDHRWQSILLSLNAGTLRNTLPALVQKVARLCQIGPRSSGTPCRKIFDHLTHRISFLREVFLQELHCFYVSYLINQVYCTYSFIL